MANSHTKEGYCIKPILRAVSRPFLVLCFPVLAFAWNANRAAATSYLINEQDARESAAYRAEFLAREDFRKGLTVGRRFPYLNLRDAHGRTLPFGSGATTAVLFSASCAAGCQDLEAIKSFASSMDRANIVFFVIGTQREVADMARHFDLPRMYFVADLRSKMHDWYGAERRRGFVLDHNGIIRAKFDRWSAKTLPQIRSTAQFFGGNHS